MKKISSKDTVYNYIRNQVVTKQLFPGNKICIEDMSAEIGVSPTAVRAALIKLNYEGIVDMIPHKGTYISKPDPEELRSVYQIRRVLEIGAFEEAVKNRTGAQLRRMERNLKEQMALPENYSRLDYVKLNQEFHWTIVEASGNPYYAKYLTELFNKVNTYMLFYDNSTDNKSLASHTMIYEALKNRDLEAGIRGLTTDCEVACSDMDDPDGNTAF